jgi:hypothetical protein
MKQLVDDDIFPEVLRLRKQIAAECEGAQGCIKLVMGNKAEGGMRCSVFIWASGMSG